MDYSNFDTVITEKADQASILKLFPFGFQNAGLLLKGIKGMVVLYDYPALESEVAGEYDCNGHMNFIDLVLYGGVDIKDTMRPFINRFQKSSLISRNKENSYIYLLKDASGLLDPPLRKVEANFSFESFKSVEEILLYYNWKGMKFACDSKYIYYTPYFKWCLTENMFPYFINLCSVGLDSYARRLSSLMCFDLTGSKNTDDPFEVDPRDYRSNITDIILGNTSTIACIRSDGWECDSLIPGIENALLSVKLPPRFAKLLKGDSSTWKAQVEALYKRKSVYAKRLYDARLPFGYIEPKYKHALKPGYSTLIGTSSLVKGWDPLPKSTFISIHCSLLRQGLTRDVVMLIHRVLYYLKTHEIVLARYQETFKA